MAVLPSKLVDRLNKTYDLGEYNFGDILQACFDSIGAQPPAGSCLTVPSYASDAAAEAVCGQVEGNAYYNSTTKTFKFWNGTIWANVDPLSFASMIATNSVNIANNQADLMAAQLQLTILENSIVAHNHDGINSQPILIKNLISTGDPAGYYYFSDGAGGVDCGPIPGAQEYQLGGVTVDTGVNTVNFSSSCFVVTQTAAGEVLVDLPSLDALKISVGNNSAAILAATSAITSANAAIAINTTDITANTAAIAAHTHDGVDSAQIEFNDLQSKDGSGLDLSLNSVPCADGSGGWTYVDKTTFAGGIVADGFQLKYATADQGPTGSVASMSWPAASLTAGKWYQVQVKLNVSKAASAGNQAGYLDVTNNGLPILRVGKTNDNTALEEDYFSGVSIPFQSAGTNDIAATWTQIGTAHTLKGTGDAIGSYIVLRELNSDIPTVF